MLACECWGCHSSVVEDLDLLQCDVVMLCCLWVVPDVLKALQSFKMSRSTCPMTRYHFPEDLNAHVTVMWEGAEMWHWYVYRQSFFIVAPSSIISRWQQQILVAKHLMNVAWICITLFSWVFKLICMEKYFQHKQELKDKWKHLVMFLR
jgi:hypothetical protein